MPNPDEKTLTNEEASKVGPTFVKNEAGKYFEVKKEIQKGPTLSDLQKQLTALDGWRTEALARVESDYQLQKKEIETKKKELEEI